MKTFNIRDEGAWRDDPFLSDMVYGGLDVMIPIEVHRSLLGMFRPDNHLVHNFNMALQAPAMLTTIRGMAVDHDEAVRVISLLVHQRDRLERYIAALTQETLGWSLQLRNFDYGALDLIDAFFGPTKVGECPECGGVGFVITQPYVPPQPTGEFYKSGPRKGQEKMKPERKERTRKCRTRHPNPGFFLSKPKLAWDAKTHQPSVDKKVLGGITKRNLPKKKAGAIRLARAILLRRKCKKLLDTARQICNAKDGRFHPHFAFGATDTHRVASKSSNMGESTNGQNVTKFLRRLLVSDPGYTLIQFDFARAESHILAAAADDAAYVDAHEGEEDTHTLVAQLCWPDRDWPTDPKEASRFASKEVFDPTLARGTLRSVSKNIQHAMGRNGSCRTVGQSLGTGDSAGQAVIDTFDATFPAVRSYITESGEALERGATFVTLPELEITRKFFSDPKDPATLRDFLAFRLQAPVAYACHLGFWRIYQYLDTRSFFPGKGDLQLLLHNHDAIVVQVKDELVADYLPRIDKLLQVPFKISNRLVTLRRDAEVGKNWRDMKGVEV